MEKKLIKFKSNTDNQSGPVDRESGIILGVSVITGNREALGHGSFIDETMVDQVVEAGNDVGKQGLKARFDHPSACFKSIGTAIGRFKNFRREGEKAVADLHLLDSAASSPEGDLRTHVLDLAEEDPDIFATSIVFQMDEAEEFSAEDFPEKDEEDAFFLPHARLKKLMACDIVDEGAANDGLFGRPDYLAEQAEKWGKENPEIVESVITNYFKTHNIDIDKLKSLTMEENKEITNEEETKSTGIKETFNKLSKLIGLSNDDEAGNTEDDEADEDSIEDVQEKLESEQIKVAALTEANEKLTGTIDEFKTELEGMKGQIDELSKIQIGTEVTLATDDNVQDPEGTKEKPKAEKVADAKAERLAENLQAREDAIKEIHGENAFGLYKN